MSTDVNFYAAGQHRRPANLVVSTLPAGAPTPAPVRPRQVVATAEEPPALEAVIESDDPRLDRLMQLMCAYFEISPEVFARDAKCRQAVQAATSLCLTYGFQPGRHVYVRKLGGVWTYETGYRAWLDSANRLSVEGRFRFDVQLIGMTAEEVRALAGERYTPEDCGFYARVLQTDIAQMYASMSLAYDPPFAFGLWRKLSYQEVDASERPTGRWLPDPIYTGRDALYTAELRARKAALMAVYSLVELNGHSVDRRLATLTLDLNSELEERATKERMKTDPHRTSILVNRLPPAEKDGDIIFA